MGSAGSRKIRSTIIQKDLKLNSSEDIVKCLKEEGVCDGRVLWAFGKVDRVDFLDSDVAHLASCDIPIPIGFGQTTSQPYTIARMLELLNLNGCERVLEIGTGSGYQTALLGLLSKEVYSAEIVRDLCLKATKNLKRLKYNNIYLKCGNGLSVWKEKAPFDRIIISAASKSVDDLVLSQLAEPGILVCPVGDLDTQQLTKYEKFSNNVTITMHGKYMFVQMVDS